MSEEAIVKVIFGIRGGGKTVKLRRLLLDCPRSITVNTLNRDGFANGVVFHTVGELSRFWSKVYRRNFRLIFSPEHGDIEKTCSEVGQICQLAITCKNLTLAVEEMNVLFEGQRIPAELNKLIYAGREPGVEFIGVAQVPTGFGPVMRAMTKEAFLFHTHEDSHLDVFRNLVGKDGAEAIRTLSNYNYVHWSMDNGPENWKIEKDKPLLYM